MNARRTPAWWSTRLELAIGVGVWIIVVVACWSVLFSPMWGDIESISLGPVSVPSPIAEAFAAFVLAVLGLIWMIRIVRGARDGSPRWRYRDR